MCFLPLRKLYKLLANTMGLIAEELLVKLAQNTWVEDFAGRWILNEDTGGGDRDVNDFQYGLFRSDEPDAGDSCLSVIIAIARLTEDKRHDGILAAGMLEDFLGRHGADYIGVVEVLARKWPRFRYLLGGVWQGSMTKDVWHRVEAARGSPW